MFIATQCTIMDQFAQFYLIVLAAQRVWVREQISSRSQTVQSCTILIGSALQRTNLGPDQPYGDSFVILGLYERLVPTRLLGADWHNAEKRRKGEGRGATKPLDVDIRPRFQAPAHEVTSDAQQLPTPGPTPARIKAVTEGDGGKTEEAEVEEEEAETAEKMFRRYWLEAVMERGDWRRKMEVAVKRNSGLLDTIQEHRYPGVG